MCTNMAANYWVGHVTKYISTMRVFHYNFQTLRSGLKKWGTASVFLTNFEVFGYLMKHFLIVNIHNF